MITEFSVKNFRGIKKGKIEGLGQVNIIVGKNNAGKSTLLDLLCFIRAPLNPANRLGEYVLESLLQRRVKREVPTEFEFFHNYSPKNKIVFEAKFKSELDLYFTVRLENRNLVYCLWGDDPEHASAIFTMQTRNTPYVQVGNRSGNQSNPLDFFLECLDNRNPVPSPDPDARFLDSVAMDSLRFIANTVLIDADFVRKIEKVEEAFWADILKERSDKKLREILNQTYGLSMEGFSFADYRDRRSKLFVLLLETAMHIDDFGDGLRYAFSMLTIASQAHDTALLLEEPEVHQHEGALSPLFEALLKLVSANHLQLFISTHSLNTLRIWTKLTQEVKIFHVALDANGQLETRSITGADAKLMIDLGINPLNLQEPISYLIVEGKQDKIFLESVAKKLKQKTLKDLGYEVLVSPKSEQKSTIPALASTGKCILSYIDFDRTDNAEDLIKPFVASLKNKFNSVELKDFKIKIGSTGSTVIFVPVGLPGDKQLSELGIKQHTIEDFMVKLLCVDKKVREWAGIDPKQLKESSLSIKDKAPLDSSKTLMMALGVIKGGKTLEELIPEAIEQADIKSLIENFGPLINGLF